MSQKTYTCPMHPEVLSERPGKCPKCGMNLVTSASLLKSPETNQKQDNNLASYKPLIIIIGLIFIAALTVSLRANFYLRNFLETFMAGFFLVFSGFKLLDLTGFAQAYSTYDLLARKVLTYGYLYPFIELFFALAIIAKFNPLVLNSTVLIVMSFSGIGVLQSLLKKRRFQCACLGTIIKVPLTQVTLIEDFGMAAMAAFLLLS